MAIVWNSYNGRYSDNPRALYEALRRRRPELEHVWLADPRFRHTFPRDVPTVPIRSAAASLALSEAEAVVANCHLTLDPWTKRPDAVYLQTWHGTPLKRIHRSAITHPPAAVMDEIDAEIARWDHLLSPSPAATRLLRSAFDYSGSVLRTGYPRNDVLLAPDAEERRERTRARLGIAPGTTAVLYAPTWRDDEVASPDVPLGLDLPALARRLGNDHVVLLRQHYYLGHRRPLPTGAQLRDVSAEPETAELYLAADVLVTDYSSSVFDFAVTGKPVVLFTYDLEHYRDRLRGFTLDLAADLPGPLVTDAAELADLLGDLGGLQATWAARYAAFRRRFCRWENGHATDRVLDALWPVPEDPEAVLPALATSG